MGGDRGALVSFDSHGCPQFAAKFFIMFDVQLATHGLAFGFATFGIEQNPFPSSRRFALASQHINEKEHWMLRLGVRQAWLPRWLHWSQADSSTITVMS